MAANPAPNSPSPRRRNAALAATCAGLVAGMVGLAYASVPLYRLFCQVTGFAGTTQVATSAPAEVLDQTVTVRFDANVSRDLNWTFQPVERSAELKIGETRLAYYRAVNHADRPVTGTATFNVTPDWTGQYFSKIQCFCFTEQTLQPGESVDMPVAFFVDPAIADDRSASRGLAITLSYTFYPVAGADKPLAAAPAVPVAADPPGGG
jgi:cytochrome c oxidase assembly protein subunit 11